MRCTIFLLTILVFQNTPLASAQQKETFIPHHVAKIRSVVAAKTSPNGTFVAYGLNVPRDLAKEGDGPAWTELHVVDIAGNARPFISGQVNVGGIDWMPGGKAISFLAQRDGDKTRSLYLISPLGGESRKVCEHETDILTYSWSPDGKQIAFIATEPRSEAEKGERAFGFNQRVFEEDNAFAKVWIATVGDSDEPVCVQMDGSAWDVQWSPKGNRLAVSVSPLPLIDHRLMFRKILVVDAKTRIETQLDLPGKMGQMTWSPDGKHLAVIAAVSKHDPREGRIWIASAEGGEWRDITPDLDGHVTKIAWNGRVGQKSELVAVIAKGVKTEVASFQLQNGRVLGPPKSLAPEGTRWPIVHEVSASKLGSAFAFIADTPKHPAEVYFFRHADEEPRRLTDHNPWLKNMHFAKQEVITYKARDGLKLQGILVRPLHEKKGKRYPIVLTVHGGPEMHVSNGWVTRYFYLGQVGAANGLAVFYPNYRGSTGRGVKFSMMGQGDAAGKEFDDLVDGVDHLVKTGLVDKNAVGVTGASYGGYAAAWCSTYYSDRFAAGVMYAGASNRVSKMGTTDIPHEMRQVHYRKSLWNDWDYFLKSSPIYHVENAQTPLLLLHGESDPRFRPSQSMELHRHLKMLGKTPVRLVLYPNEGHGNRRAASRLDYNLRLLRWMKHFLIGQESSLPPRRVDYGPNTPTKEAVQNAALRWRRPSRRLEDSQRLQFDLTGNRCPCCIWP